MKDSSHGSDLKQQKRAGRKRVEKGLCFPILFYRILFLIKICTLAVPHWYCISQPLLVAKPSVLCEFLYFSFCLEYLAAEALRDAPSWLSQDLTLQSSGPAAGCSFDAAVQTCLVAYLICSTLWPLFCDLGVQILQWRVAYHPPVAFILICSRSLEGF